jgi:hypothetical protein
MKQSRAWEQTYEAVSQGQVAVGVHSDNPSDIETATDVLQTQGSSDLHRYDREGNEVPA